MSKKPEILILGKSKIDDTAILKAVDDELDEIKNKSLLNARKSNFIDPRLIFFNYNNLENELNDTLITDQITMLHYSGHSNEIGLWVEQFGKHKTLTSESLKTLISFHENFRFIFLNSCYSETLAKKLVANGVPYVLGTMGKVGDKDASKIAAKFYEYLGIKSYTIYEAYQLTKTYFIVNQNELQIDSDFRSLTTNEEEEDKNVWKLFFDKDKLTDEQKNWTLIPKDNLILSRKENQDKIKIFCIYGDDEKSVDFFEKFSFNQDKFQNRVVNGTLNISKEFNLVSFLKEYNAATIIVNLITNEFIKFIDANNILALIENFKNKKHCYMPIFESDAIFKNAPWIDDNFILKPEPEILIKISGLDFSFQNRPPDFNDNFEAFHKTKFERILNPSVEITLEDALIEIPVSQFKETSYQNEKTFFHTIIEGSEECGLKFIIKKFKNTIDLKNAIENKITFQIKNKEQADYDLEFWSTLYNQLTTTNGTRKDIDKLPEFITECVDLILGKILTSDVLIIFDEVIIDIHLPIINSFWSKIIEKYELKIEEFKNNKEEFSKKNGIKYIGKIYAFSINNNYSIENKKSLNFNVNSTSFEAINYCPLDPLSETEFKDWPKLSFLFEKNKIPKLTYQNILDEVQSPKRLKAIKEICRKAAQDTLYFKIHESLK